ncbi:MAG: A/G-specific adenine glycosylase [Planctomycetia bacterium]|nr:A/G-specific adenine glycosylase [Planctomycetia bacterium]
MSETPADRTPSRLRRWMGPRLLAWFDAHRRELPWRRDRDPYRIWVSEVMLQQTQVTTVVPYFERFMSRWPTLADLARAEEQEVLRLWEGLGYYRRARDLLRAAQMLASSFRGAFPSRPEELEGVPGMGDYTRNAVLSQAFDLRLPILEANSQRLLSRLFGREQDPREGAARRWLWNAAEEILPTRRVGDFNQALMELGALVCTVSVPRCLACPLCERCEAYRQGRQDQIPRRNPPQPSTAISEVATVVSRGALVFIVRRPPTGRWASLWEFPRIGVNEPENTQQAAVRAAATAGLSVTVGERLTTVEHGVTRWRITLHAIKADWVSGEFTAGAYVEGRWVSVSQLVGLPVSSPQRRLMSIVSRGYETTS